MLVLEVYLSENSPNSNRLLSHIETIQHRYTSTQLTIIRIDVNKTPERALTAGILMTPAIIMRYEDKASLLLGMQTLEEIDGMINTYIKE